MFLLLRKRSGVQPPPPVNGGEGLLTRFGRAPAELSALIRTHFPATQWVNAAEIAKLESGWRSTAVADTRHKAGGRCNEVYTHPRFGSVRTELSVGYFQINICAHGGSIGQWTDGVNNVTKAAALYHARGNWGAWRHAANILGLPH